MKEGVLVLSGSPHTSGESWSWRPRGLRGRLQQGGEEEEPRNSWIDQRCGRQQVWQFNSLQLQGEEEMRLWREEEMRLWREEVKQWRDKSALPSNFTGNRVTSGYLAPMLG